MANVTISGPKASANTSVAARPIASLITAERKAPPVMNDIAQIGALQKYIKETEYRAPPPEGMTLDQFDRFERGFRDKTLELVGDYRDVVKGKLREEDWSKKATRLWTDVFLVWMHTPNDEKGYIITPNSKEYEAIMKIIDKGDGASPEEIQYVSRLSLHVFLKSNYDKLVPTISQIGTSSDPSQKSLGVFDPKSVNKPQTKPSLWARFKEGFVGEPEIGFNLGYGLTGGMMFTPAMIKLIESEVKPFDESGNPNISGYTGRKADELWHRAESLTLTFATMTTKMVPTMAKDKEFYLNLSDEDLMKGLKAAAAKNDMSPPNVSARKVSNILKEINTSNDIYGLYVTYPNIVKLMEAAGIITIDEKHAKFGESDAKLSHMPPPPLQMMEEIVSDSGSNSTPPPSPYQTTDEEVRRIQNVPPLLKEEEQQ
jgi:hypothetical protein